MKNKGFSLVELIIVIAIMAILAAAIAPALIRYIDKSRRSDDVAAAETLNTATQAALSNEDAYDEVQNFMGSGSVVLATAPANGTTAFTGQNGISNDGSSSFLYEINSSCSQKAPKIKFKKDAGSGKATHWSIGVTDDGKPIVWLATGAGGTTYEMQPNICKEYK